METNLLDGNVRECYIVSRQGKKVMHFNRENPGGHPGVSFFQGWAVLFISVQPFAYVVGDYTCQHGDKKGKKVILPEVI